MPMSSAGIIMVDVHGIAKKLIKGLTRDTSPKKLAVNGINKREITICVKTIAFNGVEKTFAERIRIITATKESQNPGIKRESGIMLGITMRAILTPCKLNIGREIKSESIAMENIIAARRVGKLIPAKSA